MLRTSARSSSSYRLSSQCMCFAVCPMAREQVRTSFFSMSFKCKRRSGLHVPEKYEMTPVGFEPTHPKIVELESTALDRSAKVSIPANEELTITSKQTRLWQCEHARRFGEIPQSTVEMVSFAYFTTSMLQLWIHHCHRYGSGSIPGWPIFCSAEITTAGLQRFM